MHNLKLLIDKWLTCDGFALFDADVTWYPTKNMTNKNQKIFEIFEYIELTFRMPLFYVSTQCNGLSLVFLNKWHLETNVTSLKYISAMYLGQRSQGSFLYLKFVL